MKKYNVWGTVAGSKWIGTFEANSPEEAEVLAWESEEAHVSMCHQCARDCEDPEIEKMTVEEDTE